MFIIRTNIHCAIAACVLVFGVIQLTIKKSGPLNRCAAIALLSLAWALFYMWADELRLEGYMKLFAHTDIPDSFLAGPSIYLTFITMMGEQESPPEHYKRHFIAPTVLFAAMLIFNIIALFSSRIILTDRIIAILSIACDLILFGYILLTIVRSMQILTHSPPKFRKNFFAMLCFSILIMILPALFIYAEIRENFAIVRESSFACGILVILYSILSFRYPEYTQRVLKAVSGKNWRSANLKPADSEKYIELIDELFEKKRVYRNPELTLDDVGALLALPPATVSQIINAQRRINFKSYLNRFRIGEICRELIVRRDLSILEIAFENGFNSKSAFNAAFLEITGMTPSQYRKKATP